MRPSDPEGFSWIELPARTEKLELFQEFILGHAESLQASPRVIQRIRLVLEEILLNIMQHAYPAGRTGMIRAGCALSRDGLFTVRIVDYAGPFDPSSRPDPDTSLSLEDREEGGLGILLARRMSDEVKYQRIDGQNILELGFRL